MGSPGLAGQAADRGRGEAMRKFRKLLYSLIGALMFWMCCWGTLQVIEIVFEVDIHIVVYAVVGFMAGIFWPADVV